MLFRTTVDECGSCVCVTTEESALQNRKEAAAMRSARTPWEEQPRRPSDEITAFISLTVIWKRYSIIVASS